MIGLIIGGILLAFVSGAGLYLYSSGKTAGRAACVAELKAADDQLVAAAAKVEQDAANKIIDMTAAYEAGEANAKTRTVYITKQGADHVAKYPVFSDPNCVLPPEALQNLNDARASFRGAAPADGVRVTPDGQGATSGPAADSSGTTPAVRAPNSVAGRNDTRVVPEGDRGRETRRPLAKLRPKG